MCAKGNPKFSCPTILSHSDSDSCIDSDSREELFDSSLNIVNVSVNMELPMDFSSSPKEEEKNLLHFYGEMDDDDFHKMMSVDDLTYSIAFSDEVFDNGEWHTYTGLETCNVIKPAIHGKETLGKGVQSNPAKGVSGNSNLTCLSGDDTKLGTDHTKADVYVMHQQDRLLLSQLRLTFPSSMDGVRNRNRSKWPRPSKLDNQTPPTKLDRAQFGM